MAVRIAALSKYNARPTVVDGIRFASQKEARRYGELKMLEKAGEISHLELQPEYRIVVTRPDNRLVAPAVYRADFRYRLKSRAGFDLIIEDCKGVRTEVYRLKKKLVEAIYGIEVLET